MLICTSKKSVNFKQDKPKCIHTEVHCNQSVKRYRESQKSKKEAVYHIPGILNVLKNPAHIRNHGDRIL
jgi:hypothetical protein